MKLLVICFLISLLLGRCTFEPGGGGSSQIAPDAVNAGEPLTIELKLSVWGSGGSISGRYTDIRAHHRLVGEKEFRTVSPKLTSKDERHEVYQFSLSPYPKGTKGEIEYYFEIKLDGQPSRVDGAKKIRIL